MSDNDIVTFELINHNSAMFTVQVRHILELESAFCNVIHEMTSAKLRQNGKKKRAFYVSLSLIDAKQGSLIIRFKATVKNLHENRNELAAYAAILGLPIALLQLTGVGFAVTPQKPDQEYAKIVEEAQKVSEDKDVRIALQRFEKATENTNSHEIIISVPGSPTISIETFDRRPDDGRLNEYIWQIPSDAPDSIIESIAKIPGVSSVEKKLFSGKAGGMRASISVSIDPDLGTKQSHKCIEDISSELKKMRALI